MEVVAEHLKPSSQDHTESKHKLDSMTWMALSQEEKLQVIIVGSSAACEQL